jgi:hypothetical protein
MDILRRTLKLRKHDTVRDVSIRISWPMNDEKAWNCHWEIDWPDRQRSNSGHGVDAIQALVHAFQMIGAELYCSDEHRSGELLWNDSWHGYGFPIPAGIRDLLVGDDAKYL